MRFVSSLALLAVACGPLGSRDHRDTTELDVLAYSPDDPQPDDTFVPVTDRDTTHRTGSSTIAVDDAGRVYNVNPDAGTITRTDVESGEQVEVAVGLEPSRIAVQRGTVYVTLRGERSLVALSVDDLEAGVIDRIEVGAEPLGLVLNGNGSRAYVAVSGEDQVLEIDTDGLLPMRVFTVAGQPRHLAIDGHGTQVYIATGRSSTPLQRLDVAAGEVVEVPLPTVVVNEPLHPRITGDPSVMVSNSTDGDRLAVPVVYLDTITPVTALSSLEEVQDPGVDNGVTTPDTTVPTGSGGYGGSISSTVHMDRMTSAIVQFDIGREGPTDDPVAFFAEVAEATTEELRPVVSTLSSVAPSSGGVWVATVEASSAVLALDPDGENAPFSILTQVGGVPSSVSASGLAQVGMRARDLTAIDAGPGVNGLAEHEGRWFANVPFDHTVMEIDREAALAELSGKESTTHTNLVPGLQEWVVSDAVLPADVALGRRLFYSAREGVMGGSGVSCSSCHVDGRDDGVVWTFDDGKRTTPSLAGRVSETEPVTWRSSVPTVQAEAEITAVARLGGSGLTSVELDAIAAFVDWTRVPDRATPDPSAVARGAEVFEAGGCAACHSGDRFTNRQTYTIRGIAVDTPSLTGVSATGPWLHDGSARSLRSVVELARTGEMGTLYGATDQELDDLVAYLQTL
jgi:mono/diheme cytochrome c family protein